MKSKRQTTRAKLARERLVQERQASKREKKRAAAAARDQAVTVGGADTADGSVVPLATDGDRSWDSP